VHITAKLTTFLGLSLQEEHLLSLPLFHTVYPLGETVGQDRQMEFGYYIYQCKNLKKNKNP
jgi:hypothetical protein